jgi:hypothetical protein
VEGRGIDHGSRWREPRALAEAHDPKKLTARAAPDPALPAAGNR